MIKVIKYRLKMIRRNPVISPILLPGVTLYSTLSTYKIRIKPFLSEKGRKRETFSHWIFGGATRV
jgi:hypothetical protein